MQIFHDEYALAGVWQIFAKFLVSAYTGLIDLEVRRVEADLNHAYVVIEKHAAVRLCFKAKCQVYEQNAATTFEPCLHIVVKRLPAIGEKGVTEMYPVRFLMPGHASGSNETESNNYDQERAECKLEKEFFICGSGFGREGRGRPGAAEGWRRPPYTGYVSSITEKGMKAKQN